MMDGGAKSPSIPSNPSENSSKSSTSNDFSLGSADFPSLIPSKIVPEKGVSYPSQNSNLNYLSCINGSAAPATSSTIKLSYVEPKSDEDTSFAFFSAGDLQPHIEICEHFIVGYFVGRRLDFDFVKQNLESQWKIKGNFSMTIHGEQAFLFKFSLEEDRARVLEIGYMHIASKLFLIRPWSPFIEQQIGKISSVPIWMILRDVPLHLWNATGFSRIVSLVGKPIMTDAPTAMMTRMAFARVCVEIEANCSFPSKLPFQIDDKKYEVRAEYPWKPTSCSHCKSFGHTSEKCSSNPATRYKKVWVPKSSSAIAIAGESEKIIEPQVDEIREEILSAEVVPLGVNVVETISTNGPSNRVDNSEVEELTSNGPPTAKWSSYTRKKKNSGRNNDLQNLVPISHLNPFDVLYSEEEPVSAGLRDASPKSIRGNIEKEHIVEEAIVSSEDCDFGSDIENLFHSSEGQASGKERSVEDIPSRIPMTKAKNIDKLFSFAASTVDPNSCPIGEMMNTFKVIADKYQNQKSWKERELERLGCKGESSNDQLGRGLRKSAKKK